MVIEVDPVVVVEEDEGLGTWWIVGITIGAVLLVLAMGLCIVGVLCLCAGCAYRNRPKKPVHVQVKVKQVISSGFQTKDIPEVVD